jgi:ketosteroid isomerase-like protein
MVAQTPEEVHPLFVKAHNAGDLDGVMSFLEVGACFVTRSGRIASGFDSVREVYRANLANRQQLVLGELTVLPAGGDIALVIFPWTSTAVLATGDTKNGKALRPTSSGAKRTGAGFWSSTTPPALRWGRINDASRLGPAAHRLSGSRVEGDLLPGRDRALGRRRLGVGADAVAGGAESSVGGTEETGQ